VIAAGEGDMALKDIDTFVFLMLENRSFDHMLGYLSLDSTPGRLPVDGIRSDPAWRAKFANFGNGVPRPVKRISGLQPIDEDPPHGRRSIAAQIHQITAGGEKMGGFVDTYLRDYVSPPPADPDVPMGYYDAEAVPTYDFLAKNYCVCDRWFASLPCGTQANRLMASSGRSKVADNSIPLPNQKLLYDWLGARGIGWRVYVHGGFAPFFLMMPDWTFEIAGSLATSGPFRRFSKLAEDWKSPKTMPNVIFVEPEYLDAPGKNPNDDHPPSFVAGGQKLVADVYRILTSNPKRWARTLLVITYDEHGGFFDHVPPLAIDGQAANMFFNTTGPRVPALLVSPHVGAGQVFSEDLDHTSFLQLLADRFTVKDNQPPYVDGVHSPEVASRNQHLGRLRNALAEPRSGPPPAIPAVEVKGLADAAAAVMLSGPASAPPTPNAAAIDAALRRVQLEQPMLLDAPEWREAKEYLRKNAPPTPERLESVGRAEEGAAPG
jgi:phospholipase C